MYSAIENTEAALSEPIIQTHNHAKKICSDCGEQQYNEKWEDEQDT
jgi:formylmethanofuran dehydrogenase subunit E